MKRIILFSLLFTVLFLNAQEKAVPVFKNGEAQIIDAFNTPNKWIRHDLWVATNFDTDGDGKKDRMHVSVTRPFHRHSRSKTTNNICN